MDLSNLVKSVTTLEAPLVLGPTNKNRMILYTIVGSFWKLNLCPKLYIKDNYIVLTKDCLEKLHVETAQQKRQQNKINNLFDCFFNFHKCTFVTYMRALHGLYKLLF